MMLQITRLIATENIEYFHSTFIVKETSRNRNMSLRYLYQTGWFHFSLNNFQSKVFSRILQVLRFNFRLSGL